MGKRGDDRLFYIDSGRFYDLCRERPEESQIYNVLAEWQ